MRTYTQYRTSWGTLTNNTTTANLDLGSQLVMDSLRYLTTKYFFDERTQVIPGGTVASQQGYNLPYNIKTILNLYVNVGNIRYQPKEVPNRAFWDSLNFVPYTSDIPQYYFIFNKQVYLFPTPSSSSNVITVNYKARITDMSQADYTTGTVTMTNASSVIAGAGTTFTSSMAGRWIQPAMSSGGDNNWYEISSYTSTTVLGLVNQYQGTTNSSISYIIGEVPWLPEDYQDLPLYRGCQVYFTTRVPDPTRAQGFKDLYDTGHAALDAEFGSKSNSVAITPQDEPVINPNLFARNIG